MPRKETLGFSKDKMPETRKDILRDLRVLQARNEGSRGGSGRFTKQTFDTLNDIRFGVKNPTTKTLKAYRRDIEQQSKGRGKIRTTKESLTKQRDFLIEQDTQSNQLTNVMNSFLNGSPGDSIIIQLDQFTKAEDVVKRVHNLNGNFVIIQADNGTGYVLTPDNKPRMLKMLGDFAVVQTEVTESDGQSHLELSRSDSITLTLKKRGKQVKEGGFFPFLNLTKFDFSRYGVFKSVDKEELMNSCLYNAVSCVVKDEVKLHMLKGFLKSRYTPMTKLEQTGKLCNIYFQVKQVRDKHIRHYNREGKTLIRLGLIDNHYFIIEDTNVTRYALEHYDEVKELENCNEVYKNKDGYFFRDQSRFADSFNVIKLLDSYRDTLLTPITLNDDILSTQWGNCFNEIKSLDYDVEKCTQDIDIKTYDNKQPKMWFDFEATTDGEIHVPYLCRSIDEHNNTRAYWGSTCAEKFLKSIKKDTLIIAHNLGYDYRFLAPYVKTMNKIQKGNKVLSAKMRYNGIKISAKCSYALTDMPLAKFGKCFNLKQEKGIMPYKAYTNKSVQEETYPIKEALAFLKPNLRKAFLADLHRLDLVRGVHFDHMAYADYYCKLDCSVLKEGYMKFREWMKKITTFDIDSVVSLASLAHRHLVNKGCYDGVKELAGVPREFLMRCVVGGRTMTRNNRKFHCKRRVQDFDAVSLYPSAMKRMMGFLKGCPKVLKELDYQTVKRYDGYFVEIEVLNVGKRRHFPLLNTMTEDGVRLFSNDIRGTVYVDKTGLEDLIKYQKIEFKIKRGYYFNEGHNPTIKTVIADMFEARKTKKAEGNPVQSAYKLLMNSAYGKTIMKPIDCDTKELETQAETDKFIDKYYNHIKDFTQMAGTEKHTVRFYKSIDQHFAIPQVGVEVLSMSKRLMNEVITLAEDLDINIYYQDTDSMHIDDDKINLLASKFKKLHGRELIGTDMGQFHCDFDFEHDKGTTPVAVETVGLGKKSYLDVVECIRKGKKVYDYHIRMKGIPADSITDLDADVLKTYLRMYNNEIIEFDLLKSGCKFEFGLDLTVKNKSVFKRTVKFISTKDECDFYD